VARSLGQLFSSSSLFSRQEDQRRRLRCSVIMVIVIIIIIMLVGCPVSVPVSLIAYTFNCFKLPPTNLTDLCLIPPLRYATILAFDVKIEREAQEMADSLGVKIFQADIIYHLFDKFTAYREELKQKKREEFRSVAVFPCKLRVSKLYDF